MLLLAQYLLDHRERHSSTQTPELTTPLRRSSRPRARLPTGADVVGSKSSVFGRMQQRWQQVHQPPAVRGQELRSSTRRRRILSSDI
jgi:hypothetical protein